MYKVMTREDAMDLIKDGDVIVLNSFLGLDIFVDPRQEGPGAFAGVGGFANITAKTKSVIFCLTFNTKGLNVEEKDGTVTITNEGTVSKFVNDVKSISFSAKRAKENGQRVLYVTERCVFELADKGLKLIEVYPGIDIERDILSKLSFDVEVAEDLEWYM